jgi:hypothetical protein
MLLKRVKQRDAVLLRAISAVLLYRNKQGGAKVGIQFFIEKKQ